MTEPSRKSPMQAYAPVAGLAGTLAGMTPCPPDDLGVFDAAHTAFQALADTLASIQAAGWTCDQLEDHLQVEGRELLRLLLQGHLDLRAARERHAVAQAAAQGQVVAITDAAGIPHAASSSAICAT
jgi:hypothetical protein